MDSAPFDKRGYPVVSAQTGYAEWADHYDSTVAAELDRPALLGLRQIDWKNIKTALDLACGTGRTGTWLSEHGVGLIDGIDITDEMRRIAEAKGVYRHLYRADVAATGLLSASYDLCTLVLADEHLSSLQPVYNEAARMLQPAGYFVLVGYHPFFLITGTPTHYHRRDGEPVSIRSYIHLFSDHFAAGRNANLTLLEFHEHLIDEGWVQRKPKWREYMNWPVSFAMLWRRN